jgi:hypothetical protein
MSPTNPLRGPLRGLIPSPAASGSKAAVLRHKTEKDADVGAHGPNFDGIHHFGFEVDDLDVACQNLENAHAQRLTAKDGSDAAMRDGVHTNFEMKWAGPDGVVIDVSHTGWEGTH